MSWYNITKNNIIGGKTMDLLLFAIGLLGIIVSIILLVINLIKKKPKKKALISLVVCLVLIVVGLAMPSSSSNDDSETQAKLENNELEVQSEQEEQEEIVYAQADTATEEVPKESQQNDKIIKDDVVIEFETGVEAEFSISNEDYNKYNEILDYMNENYEKSEAELFEELAVIYGESAESLNSFILDNMQNAINRDMVGNTLTIEDIDNLVNKFIGENIIGESVIINSIDSEIQGVGSISHADIKVDEQEYKVIVKFNFSDDYKTADVIQVKIDNKNIDL